MRKPFHLSLVLSALFFNGCAGTSAPNNQPPPPAGVQVSVSPPTANIRAVDSFPFSAAVSGTTNTAVTWSITGTAGSPPVIGTITSAGNYTAPATWPNPNTITVRTTSAADTSVSDSSSVTLLNPTPGLPGINPSSVGTGNFTLTVTGSKFVNGAQVLFGATPMQTIFGSATQLTTTGSASSSGTYAVSVSNPNPGSSSSSSVNLRVTVRTPAPATVMSSSSTIRIAFSMNFSAPPSQAIPATPRPQPSGISFRTMEIGSVEFRRPAFTSKSDFPRAASAGRATAAAAASAYWD